MKVIVKQSGWYGASYFEENKGEQEMPDIVAKPFLPPYGDQLEEANPKNTESKTQDKTELEKPEIATKQLLPANGDQLESARPRAFPKNTESKTQDKTV